MRLRSLLALCAATATAVSVLGVPAGAQETSPKAGATKAATATSVRSPQTGSTGSRLGCARPSVPRRRREQPLRPAPPARRRRSAPSGSGSRSTTSTAGCTARTTRCAAWATRSRSGSPATRRPRPARVPGRRLPQRTPGTHDVTDAQVAGPGHAVRHQHVPEGVGGVQRRARPRRHRRRSDRRDGSAATTPATATRSSRWSTTSGTTTSTTSRPPRPTSPGFFSSQFNDLVDRNVMTIDAFDWLHRTGAEPGRRADRRPVHQPPRAAPALRGRLRPRVPAPAAVLHRPGRGQLRQRGPVRLRASRWSATATPRRRCPRRAPRATSTASRASARCRRRSTRTRGTAVGRRTR